MTQADLFGVSTEFPTVTGALKSRLYNPDGVTLADIVKDELSQIIEKLNKSYQRTIVEIDSATRGHADALIAAGLYDTLQKSVPYKAIGDATTICTRTLPTGERVGVRFNGNEVPEVASALQKRLNVIHGGQLEIRRFFEIRER